MKRSPPTKINPLTSRQEWGIIGGLFLQFFLCAFIANPYLLIFSALLLFFGPHLLYLGTNFFPKLLLLFELNPFKPNTSVTKLAFGLMVLMLIFGFISIH